jgi:hypothetical protein
MDKNGNKTGGRTKGTPNKVSGKVKSVMERIVSNYFTEESGDLGKFFIEDFGKLDPKERVDAIIKMAAFVAPKPQTVAFDTTPEAKKTIEDKLRQLAQENDV